MLVCGIELKGAEAIICLLDYRQGTFNVADCRTRSITLSSLQTSEAIQKFKFTFAKLIEDYKIDQLVVIERAHKGKFAGSAASFKMEAAVQLLDTQVSLISNTEIKELIKRNPLDVSVGDLGLKQFQQPAFSCAYAFQNKILYATQDS